jgi:hypothetical protein
MTTHAPLPPTQEETQAALDKINAPDVRREAGAALHTLAEAIVRLVTAIDRSHNVGAYLCRLELIAHGEGNFELRLDDRNTGIDPEAVARDVAASIALDGGDYGKPLRPVQLEFGGGLCRTKL